MSKCVAITTKGAQCSRAPIDGSNYCWQHDTGKMEEASEADKARVAMESVEGVTREIAAILHLVQDPEIGAASAGAAASIASEQTITLAMHRCEKLLTMAITKKRTDVLEIVAKSVEFVALLVRFNLFGLIEGIGFNQNYVQVATPVLLVLLDICNTALACQGTRSAPVCTQALAPWQYRSPLLIKMKILAVARSEGEIMALIPKATLPELG